MANRFFQAGQHQYQSQFVPRQLPLDLMAKGLANKESQYQTTQKAILDARAAFNERAYGTSHKAKLGEIEGRFDEFVEDSWNKDLTSPDFIREYQQFTTEFANNKDLSTIRARQANVDKLIEEERTLRVAGQLNTARYWNVQKQLNKANSDDDMFSDTLSGAIIGEEQDTRAAYEDVFNHIKASGFENIEDFSGVYYEKGWSGISGTKVGDVAENALGLFYNTPAGRQEMLEYQYQVDHGAIDPNNVSPEKFILDRMLKVGEEFVHGKSTSGKAAAMNTAADKAAEAKAAQQMGISGLFGTTSTKYTSDYAAIHGVEGASSGMYQEKTAMQFNITQQMAAINQAKDVISNPNKYRGESGKLLLTEEEKTLIRTSDFGDRVLNNQGLTSAQRIAYLNHFDEKLEPLQRKYGTNKLWLDDQDRRLAKAYDNTFQNKYDGQSAEQAIEAVLGENADLGDRNSITDSQMDYLLSQLNATMAEVYEPTEEVTIGGMTGTQRTIKKDILPAQRQGVSTGLEGDAEDFTRYINFQNTEAKQDYESGLITQDEYDNLIDDIQEVKTYGMAYIAKKDIQRELQAAHDDPDDSSLLTNFNAVEGGTSQAIADLKPRSKTYAVYDDNNRKVGTLSDPVWDLEFHMKNDPSSFTFYDRGGNPVDEASVNWQDAEIIHTDRSNSNPFDDHASMTVKATVNLTRLNEAQLEELLITGQIDQEDLEDIKGMSDDQKAELDVEKYKQQVTFKARINDSEESSRFLAAMADKEYNNYKIDPSSAAGQESYIKYKSYTDREFAQNLHFADMQMPGDNHKISRKVITSNPGEKVKQEYVNFVVEKLPNKGSIKGGFNVSIVDAQGNVIEKERTYADIGKVSGYIDLYEQAMQQMVQNGTLVPGEVYNP